MDFATRKYRLLEKLIQIGSEEQLKKLEGLFKKEIVSEEDVWESLPDTAQQLIEKSQEQSANEEVIPHDMVMEKIKEKYKLPNQLSN